MSASSISGSQSSTSTVKTYALFSSSSQTTSIKLDRSNYLVWESVVLALIKGNHLTSHIDGTTAAPPRCIPQESKTDNLVE
ncbi:Retrovirus-related Pol polyprotein from transposon RE1 [Senna tora]|uniref:Retrovirus-related Pol polyprotein from transposon RE1 n=1 Tax=Senna tora TaxID=362788 RepID=A0A834SYS4_9FABA|nr:Retrovirus-related Pol polyprotein from transposon RE1 [Senna tora]